MICGVTKNLSKSFGTIETFKTILTILKKQLVYADPSAFQSDKVTIAILPTYPAVSQYNYSTLSKI